MSQAGDKLDGWKEIADYLGRSVKTAQRYEKQYGLPVHRLAADLEGTRPTVYAFTDELDEWLRGQRGPGDAGRSATRRKRPSAIRWGVAGAAALVLILAAVLWYEAADVREVQRVGRNTLVAFDAVGEQLWRKEFGTEFKERLRAGPAWHVTDLDGDGTHEVLFARRRPTSMPGETDAVLCYDHEGETLWRWRPGRAITIDGRTFRNQFQLEGLQPGVSSSGDRFVAVVSNHRPYSPSQTVILGPSGRELGEYWNVGYVLDLLVLDFDGAAGDEILIGGINDTLEKPFLAVLKPDIGPSMAPGPTEFPPFLETGRETSYVVFPSTAAARELGVGSWVRELRRHDEGVLVDVTWDDGSDLKERVYLVGPDLSVQRLVLGRAFFPIHESLRAEGRVAYGVEEARKRLEQISVLVR